MDEAGDFVGPAGGAGCGVPGTGTGCAGATFAASFFAGTTLADVDAPAGALAAFAGALVALAGAAFVAGRAGAPGFGIKAFACM